MCSIFAVMTSPTPTSPDDHRLPQDDVLVDFESEELGLGACVGGAFALALSYVLSLYVWRSKHDRDHPETIKRRFLSAMAMTVASPAFAYCLGSPELLSRHGLAASIGLRRPGLVSACALPLALTALLFLGPLAMLLSYETTLHLLLSPYYWRRCATDLIWWRNHVVAPFTEEFTFRACMVPILLCHFSPQWSAVVSPLFFGVAHLHHMVERLRKGQPLAEAVLVSVFQMSYTTIFGIYSAFLFLRTGHLMAPVIAHGFCNFMGFPDLAQLLSLPAKERLVFSVVYLAGTVMFFLSLYPLTEPALFYNDVFAW